MVALKFVPVFMVCEGLSAPLVGRNV